MKRILIVEDNEMNRDVLSRHLKRRGFDVLVAMDGAQGLMMAESQRPDVILMDLGLPELDGWECTKRLKANPATCEIPVVALSARAMADDRERAFEVGCDDFDTKPIDLASLLLKMERLLASRHEARPS